MIRTLRSAAPHTLLLVAVTVLFSLAGCATDDPATKENGSSSAAAQGCETDKLVCKVDADCDADELCAAGKCASRTAEDAEDAGGADKIVCKADGDCDPDERCVSGRCAGLDGDKDGCSADADCDADERCAAGKCVDKEESGAECPVACKTNADCEADEVCANGKCD